MQELQTDNDKLRREVASLMNSIAKTVNFEKTSQENISQAGKEFLGEFPGVFSFIEVKIGDVFLLYFSKHLTILI